jgi:Fe-S cluster assembly iron-binding protein IscA
MIIDLTPKAKDELIKVVETKKTDKPLRIYIASYG